MTAILTLTDPTNEQINAAVAEHVAGYSKGYAEHSTAWTHKGAVSVLPPFATSADAVLPYLEKHYIETDWIGGPVRHYTSAFGLACWRVRIPGTQGESEAPTFPLAICLALLRAHGVEVTFTK